MKKVQVEISEETLCRLFMKGQLCAAELNCLNLDSKHTVQNLCLESCLYRFGNKAEKTVHDDKVSSKINIKVASP